MNNQEEKICDIDSVIEEEIQVTSLRDVYKTAAAAKEKAPKVEAPKVEAPKVEAPKVEAPKVEAPKVEAPKKESKALQTVNDFLSALDEQKISNKETVKKINKEKEIKMTTKIEETKVQAQETKVQAQETKVQAQETKVQAQETKVQAPEIKETQVAEVQESSEAQVKEGKTYEINGTVQGVVYIIFSGKTFVEKIRVMCSMDADRVNEALKNGYTAARNFVVNTIEGGENRVVEARPAYNSSLYYHPNKPKPVVRMKVVEKEVYSAKKGQNITVKQYTII